MRLVATFAVLAMGALGLGACGSEGRSAAPAPVPAAAATKRAPAIAAGFVGIVSEDAFAAGPKDRRDILAGQKRTGVELIRQTFDWSQIERTRGRYTFAHYDRWVGAVSRAGIAVLPVLIRPPRFEQARPQRGARVTKTTTLPPRDVRAMARFATALVERYGPAGSYWAANPTVPRHPIRAWQVWNEPNLPAYWGGKPSARAYVAMLKAVGAAIHRADPAAEVVTAGLPESRLGVPLARYLRQMLAAGAGRLFDTLAVHPYAATADGVMAAVRQVRLILSAAGVRAPIWVTEIGWASDGPRSSFTVGAARQAQLVLDTISSLALAARTMRVRGVVYFNWRDAVPYAGGKDFWGLHTGLLRRDGTGKTALSTFYQAAGVVQKLRAAG